MPTIYTDLDAERTFLGYCLQETKLPDGMDGNLTPEDFSEGYRLIARSIFATAKKGSCDVISVAAEMQKHGVGTFATREIATLAEAAPIGMVNVENLIAVIKSRRADGDGVQPETTPVLPSHESFDSFLARDIKGAPSLVGDGLIVEKGLHTFIGPTKKGKTIFGVQLALTMAGGREWWLIPDLLIHRPIPVLYLNLEMPEEVFEARLQKQLRQMQAEGYNVKRAWTNFRRLTLRGKMRLDRKDGRELLVRLIRDTKAKLVVVDNLGAAMAVDSNTDERMAPIFLALYEICESEDVAILLVLHTPKDLGDRDEVYWARGSSVQADRADTIMTIKPYGNEEQSIQRRIGFTLRCGPELDPLIVSRQKGSLIWTAGKQKDVRVQWLRGFLQEHKEVAQDEAQEAFETAGHGKRSTFFKTVKQLGLDVLCAKAEFGGKGLIQWVGP